MVNATEAACSRLLELLADHRDDVAVRVSIRDRQLKTRADKRRPGDAVLEHEGRPLLLLDENSSRRVRNRVLDVRETASGPKLGFRHKAK